ncbi:MAG TPA: hypothetical protein VND93_06020 [Myxococcales bacterium]|nr:hypothetical protein [Myxococcales bacterium]
MALISDGGGGGSRPTRSTSSSTSSSSTPNTSSSSSSSGASSSSATSKPDDGDAAESQPKHRHHSSSGGSGQTVTANLVQPKPEDKPKDAPADSPPPQVTQKLRRDGFESSPRRTTGGGGTSRRSRSDDFDSTTPTSFSAFSRSRNDDLDLADRRSGGNGTGSNQSDSSDTSIDAVERARLLRSTAATTTAPATTTPATAPPSDRVQSLKPDRPLTSQQVDAYKALGYQVTPVTTRPIRDPDAPANLLRPTTSYVLKGGPPLSTFGELTPKDVGDIYAAANTLPAPQTDPFGYREKLPATVDATPAMWKGDDLKPGATAALATFVVNRFPPPTPPSGDSLDTFTNTVAGLRDVAADNPQAQSELSQSLAHAALRPDNAARGVNSSEIAAAALDQVASPQIAADVIHAIGPQDMGRFTASLALNPSGPDDPTFLNSGSRALALTSFAQQAAQIPPAPPDPAVASFFIKSFEAGSTVNFNDPTFRGAMGQGLANAFAMGDPAVAASEGDRLQALLSSSAMGDVLTSVTPQEREQIALGCLTTPSLTAALLDQHGGNLATAMAYAQYDQAATLATSDLLGGQPRLGPDGQPIISTAPLPPLPAGFNAAQNPAIARLPQPPTAAAIQQAVQSGQLTGADAAKYLRSLADVTKPIADANMQAMGASPALTNVIGFFEDMNPFNDPNPLRRSHVDQLAQRQRSALLSLADTVEKSSNPALIAQGLSAGMAVDGAYWKTIPPYKDAVNAIAGNVQRNRVLTMVAVGVVASVAAPMMAAAGLPAIGATGTIFGMTVTGSPFLSAALPAAITGVMSTTTNAAMQAETTGQVNWANAILGGTVDGLTSFYGATVAARAMQQGYGFTRTVLPAAAIDAAGGFGSYVLGTPGALQGILSGDQQSFEKALGQAGFSFALSAGINGVMYRVNLGDAAPLGAAQDYAQNKAAMEGLLDPAHPASFIGLDGKPGDLASLAGQGHESYFAVYRNRATGDLQVMEVARSRPGDPLQLQPFDALQAVRRNNPGAGWEAVGGFHNHPGGTPPSAQDLAMEPLFRGEFGPGYASYTVGGGRADPFLNPEVKPLTLQQAYASGYQVPGLAESTLSGEMTQSWKDSTNRLIENYSRPLNAIISDPNIDPAVRNAAQSDMTEMYRRFGDVLQDAPAMGSIPGDKQAGLSDLNGWLSEVMPKYRPYFDQANSHGYYNWEAQVSRSNANVENTLQMQQQYAQVGYSPAPFLQDLKAQGNGTVHVVGLANGGGAPAGDLWSQAAQDGFNPGGGQFGLLVPTQRTSNVGSDFTLSVTPRPGDTVVLVDDIQSGGDSAKQALSWLKDKYPDVSFVFLAPQVRWNEVNGVPYHDLLSVYAPGGAGGGGQ